MASILALPQIPQLVEIVPNRLAELVATSRAGDVWRVVRVHHDRGAGNDFVVHQASIDVVERVADSAVVVLRVEGIDASEVEVLGQGLQQVVAQIGGSRMADSTRGSIGH